jgi:glutathione reductase (NADPH)
MKYDYDLFTIGAGSGGVRASRFAAGFGARVGIAELGPLGGTCVNVGCVPKKLLVYAAHYHDDFAESRGFGWTHSGASFTWREFVARKDAEIARLNRIYGELLDNSGVTRHAGRAVLQDAHTIKVGDSIFTSERILIATGGVPDLPEIPGAEHVISSNEAFHLEALPRRIVIVGGGYIAVEFAGIFQGLGVETTLVYRGPLFLRGFDTDCRKLLTAEMTRRGIRLLFDTRIAQIEVAGKGYRAGLADGGHIEADLFMYATGRRPNTQGLGLEAAGVKLNDKGAVLINDEYQSSAHSIYAIGDVTDRHNLTPVATAEGMALTRRLYGGMNAGVDYSNIPTCVFSQPNLGAVGLTEEEARRQGRRIAVYKSDFTPLKHTLTESGEEALLKLIVDRDNDRVIGAHMLGAEAGEIIQGIAVAMKAGATKRHFDETIGIHPTTAEEFVTMREPEPEETVKE